MYRNNQKDPLNPEDFKELFVLLLSKFTNKTLFVIDHSIDNLFETATYEVCPSELGSTFKLK
jgi:hypothetical protein